MSNLSKTLTDAVDAGTNVFVSPVPEVLDFTDPDFKGALMVVGMGGNVVNVPLDKENVFYSATMLKLTVFSKGMKIIGWNWKNFLSYMLAVTGKPYEVEGSLIDLKVLELYAGIKEKVPESLAVALNRLKALVTKGIWKEAQKTYQSVHLPLITEVVPALENCGILDTENRKKLHAYYEICGQDNGRMNCNGAFRDNFVPITLSSTDRLKLKPRSLDELFMYFDFKNMEVSMLQHLSGDVELGKVLEKEDAYSEIYEMITGIKGDPDCREKAKKMFLPVIYGQSSANLGKRLKVAEATAHKIVTRIYDLFPTALRWVESYQEQAKQNGWVKDNFGKRRHFDQGESFLARNFSIQAPAATICLEKLVKIHEALKGMSQVAYSVYDGYCVYATKKNWKTVFQKGCDILTSESELCPGLRLKVACRAGRNLDDLKPLAKSKGV